MLHARAKALYPPEINNVSTLSQVRIGATETNQRMGYLEYERERVEKLKVELQTEVRRLEGKMGDLNLDKEVR